MARYSVTGFTHKLILLGLLNCENKISEALEYGILTMGKIYHREVL